MKRIIYVFLFAIMTGASYGQDLHYSMFFNSPLNLNPGLTGIYNGDQRFHANYRRQWFSWPVEYQSFDLGGEFKFRNEENENFFALGALFNYDTAGDLSLRYNGLDIFGSYALKLGPGYLSPGIGLGIGFRNYNTSNALLGEFWNGSELQPGTALDPLHQGAGDASLTFFDINLGVNYRYQETFRKYLDVGISLNNLAAPTQSFNAAASDDANLFRKFNVYAMANWRVAEKIDIIGNALFSAQEVYRETVLNAQAKVYLNDSFTTALHLGGGIRLGDAWYPMIAIQYNKLYAAFSYDLDISGLSKGYGPEFAVRYIIAAPPFTAKKPCPIY